MDVIIDAVPPSVAPAAGLEQILHHGYAIVSLAEMDGASIDDARPP